MFETSSSFDDPFQCSYDPKTQNGLRSQTSESFYCGFYFFEREQDQPVQCATLPSRKYAMQFPINGFVQK